MNIGKLERRNGPKNFLKGRQFLQTREGNSFWEDPGKKSSLTTKEGFQIIETEGFWLPTDRKGKKSAKIREEKEGNLHVDTITQP